MKAIREMKKQVKRLGYKVIAVEKGKKHPKLVVTNGPKTIRVVIPATASCPRSRKNSIAFIKRQFRN